ncbi:MAG TPA: STAS domain-containing protein [Conexibacter sp.]|nr:STAS domain-containing protein [Conexibacter sp.]
MSLLARVQDERHDDISIAAIDGEIDASNVVAVGEQLRALLTNRSTTLVIDLTDTRYLDSAGINLLFELSNELTARQQTLRLVVPAASPMLRMFRIAGLMSAIPTHETRAAVLAQEG